MTFDTKAQHGIILDLVRKVGDDVGAVISRALSIAPNPHLPIAMSAGVSAVAAMALLLDTERDTKAEIDPDCLLLAGLLLGRSGGKDATVEAYKDFAILKAAGRAALTEESGDLAP